MQKAYQGRGKAASAFGSADNTYLSYQDLDYFGYHKTESNNCFEFNW